MRLRRTAPMQASMEGQAYHHHLGRALSLLCHTVPCFQPHSQPQACQAAVWPVQDRACPVCLAGDLPCLPDWCILPSCCLAQWLPWLNIGFSCVSVLTSAVAAAAEACGQVGHVVHGGESPCPQLLQYCCTKAQDAWVLQGF